MDEMLPDRPKPLAVGAPQTRIADKRSFWIGVWMGSGSAALLVLGPLCIDRGFEVSGVKANIIHACLWWSAAWIIFSLVYWAWTTFLGFRTWKKVTPIIAVPVLISLVSGRWFVEQYQIQHDVLSFTVSLQVVEFPGTVLEITNDFFRLPKFNSEYHAAGCVIVPIRSDTTNLTINFRLRNRAKVLPAETVHTIVSIPTNVVGALEYGWRKWENENRIVYESDSAGPITNLLASWSFHCPDTIFPQDGIHLPAIRLKPIPFIQNQINPSAFAVTVKAKDFVPTCVIGHLIFMPTNTISAKSAFSRMTKPVIMAGIQKSNMIKLDDTNLPQ